MSPRASSTGFRLLTVFAVCELRGGIARFRPIGHAKDLSALPLFVDRGRAHAEHLRNMPTIEHSAGARGHLLAEPCGFLARRLDGIQIGRRVRSDIPARDAERVPQIGFAANNVGQRIIAGGLYGLRNRLRKDLKRPSAQRVAGSNGSARS